MPFRRSINLDAASLDAAPLGGAPRVPPGQRLYAIGDVHGRSDLLDRLLLLVRADAAMAPDLHHTLVLLGDYVDRGPDSAGVIDRLAAGPPPGFGQICLKGNHEEMLCRFLADPGIGPAWLRLGGRETLASYGVHRPPTVPELVWLPQAAAALAERLPPRHRGFLRHLRPCLTVGDYLFVHAGVRPGVALDRQAADDLLWIREPFLSHRGWHGKVVVHGHSAAAEPVVLCRGDRPVRIGIDTGAVASGRLTALVLEGSERRFLRT